MPEISIITEDGMKYAKLPLDSFIKMSEEIEHAHDVRLATSASRDPRDYIPLEVAQRIWDGANPVRAWREYRALTQGSLAASAGLTRSFLSQIETGRREMSVSTLQKLAAILDTDLSFLLPSG